MSLNDPMANLGAKRVAISEQIADALGKGWEPKVFHTGTGPAGGAVANDGLALVCARLNEVGGIVDYTCYLFFGSHTIDGTDYTPDGALDQALIKARRNVREIEARIDAVEPRTLN